MTVCSILDIDLDYFNEGPDAADDLRRLLLWADRPVAMVVERHKFNFIDPGLAREVTDVLSEFMGMLTRNHAP